MELVLSVQYKKKPFPKTDRALNRSFTGALTLYQSILILYIAKLRKIYRDQSIGRMLLSKGYTRDRSG